MSRDFASYWGAYTDSDRKEILNRIPVSTQPVKTETKAGQASVLTSFSGPAVPTKPVLDPVDIYTLPPRYSYGSPTSGHWQQTTSEDKVQAGDVLRFTHKLRIPFVMDYQSDKVVENFRKDARFDLLYYGLNDETGILIVEVRTRSSFSPVPLVAAAVVALLAIAFVWVTTISIERLGTVKTPLGTFNITGFLVAAAVAIVGLKVFTAARS